MDIYKTDVLVVGSGGAGLRAAIASRKEGCHTLVVSKSTRGLGSSTILAGGGFGSSGFGMSADEYMKVTLEVGYHLNNPALVRVLAEEAHLRIEELRQRGAHFKEAPTGVVTTAKPPHSMREVTDVLVRWAVSSGAKIIDWLTVAALTVQEGRVTGCIGVKKDGKPFAVEASAVVICTGGASALYKFHDNPTASIGDGYALAYHAGTPLQDMELIQFYPLIADEPHAPRTLIHPYVAEAGRIINDKEEDLLEKYDLNGTRPVALKARDRLSRAMFQEYRSGSTVYLDLRQLTDSHWNHPFMHNVRDMFERRFHASEKPIRIMPVAHFTMGGVVIDENGKTGVEGLFAAGEVACGLHGANRMGGNALSETLVFGLRAGVAAARSALQQRQSEAQADSAMTFDPAHYSGGRNPPLHALQLLKEMLWTYCGPIRNGKGLANALDKIHQVEQEGIRCHNGRELALAVPIVNGFTTARLIIQGAINRKESIGAHFRED